MALFGDSGHRGFETRFVLFSRLLEPEPGDIEGRPEEQVQQGEVNFECDLIEINVISCVQDYRCNAPVIPVAREVMMFTWLDKPTLEWIIFVVLLILIFGCGIWRLSFGVRDEHRNSRRN